MSFTMLPRTTAWLWVVGVLAFMTASTIGTPSAEAEKAKDEKPPPKEETSSEESSGESSESTSDESAETAKEEEDSKVAPAVKGKKGRRKARMARLIRSFRKDKLAIYQRYGFPSYRYRERDARRVTEHWVYVRKDIEFIFVGNKLIRRH